LNNKKLPIKTTSAIFLATVLIAGTFAAISPSSFIIGANAQREVYNYGMEDRYDIYGPQYPPEYKDKDYNGYEPDYEMDSYDKKLYRNDYNEQPKEYPSYKQDYNKPEYPQYGKDNSYKSNDNSYKSKKDSSSSVSINKLNCINNNVNINGNNAGNISLGNSGSSATTSPGTDEGYVGVGSVGGNGEGYDNGDNKQKGEIFSCIINNNNINNNFDNETIPEPITCEECFTENLSAEQLDNLTEFLAVNPVGSLEGFCEQLSNATFTNQQKLLGLVFVFFEAGITDEDAFLRILECLEELGLIIVPPNLGLPPDTNTGISAFDINTAGGLTPSFSSPPTITQGTEEDLTALEKIEKLKKQWLGLLP